MSYAHQEYYETSRVPSGISYVNTDVAPTRTSYERFLEFERLMRMYPSFSSSTRRFNPTPLGFCAFALTLFVFSMYNAGVAVPVSASHGVLMGLALFYGGVIQTIAGLLEFRVGNNINALTFCSYGGFWLGLASLYIGSFSFLFNMDITVQNKAFGIFFLAWAIFTFALLISSVRTNVVFIVLLFCLTLTFALLTACKLRQDDYNIQRAAGAFGILTAAIAWYAAFASLLIRGQNSYFSLPVINLAPSTPMMIIDEPLTEIRSQKL